MNLEHTFIPLTRVSPACRHCRGQKRLGNVVSARFYGVLVWLAEAAFLFCREGLLHGSPDQRGYNHSSKPSGVKAYKLEKLTADIVELIGQLCKEKVVLVGHDWDGVVACDLAMHFPHLLHKLVVLSIPHPGVMQKYLRQNPKQMLRSWYTASFQMKV